MLHTISSERQFIMYEALRKGATVEELHDLTQDQELLYRSDEGACGGGGGTASSIRDRFLRLRCCARPS